MGYEVEIPDGVESNEKGTFYFKNKNKIGILGRDNYEPGASQKLLELYQSAPREKYPVVQVVKGGPFSGVHYTEADSPEFEKFVVDNGRGMGMMVNITLKDASESARTEAHAMVGLILKTLKFK